MGDPAATSRRNPVCLLATCTSRNGDPAPAHTRVPHLTHVSAHQAATGPLSRHWSVPLGYRVPEWQVGTMALSVDP